MNDIPFVLFVSMLVIIAMLVIAHHNRTKMETEKWVRLVLAAGDLRIFKTKEIANEAIVRCINNPEVYSLHARSVGETFELPYFIAMNSYMTRNVEPEYIVEAVNRFLQMKESDIKVVKLVPYIHQNIPQSRPSTVAMS